jgi:pyrophosphatase PpaX
MANKTYKYWLLDWDGCLADSLEMWMDIYLTSLKMRGLNPGSEVIVKKVFGNWHGVKNIGVQDLKGFYDELSPLAERGMQRVKLHDGVVETLKVLKKNNNQIAIVTSSLRKVIEPAVKRLGLSKLVDCIFAADDVGEIKPDPEVVYKALDALGGDKEIAIIVGDTDKDVGAGKNAGIATAIFYPKENEAFYKLGDLEKLQADYLFTDFRELVSLVN